MNHSFNVEIATQYGIEKAVLLEYFNVLKSVSSKPASIKDISDYLVYINKQKLGRLLRELEEDGYIVSTQDTGMDRTKLYTLKER